MVTALYVNFSDAQEQLTFQSLQFELIQALTAVNATCKNEEDPFKNEGESGHNIFPILNIWEFFQTLKDS